MAAASVDGVLLESLAAALDVALLATLASATTAPATETATATSSTTAVSPAGPSWTDQLSAVATAAAVLVALFTLVVAVLAARYTKRQVDYARSQVDSARDQLTEARTLRREQAQPYVVMYAEPSAVDALAVEIVVKNYGTTAAFDVALNVEPTLRRSNFRAGSQAQVIDVRIPHVIPILAPGQEFRTLWDHGHHRKEVTLAQEHHGTVTYRDSHRDRHESPVHLSWHQVHERTWLEQYGPHHAAKALREIGALLKKWDEPPHGLRVVVRDGHVLDGEEELPVTATTRRRRDQRERRRHFAELRQRGHDRRARGPR